MKKIFLLLPALVLVSFTQVVQLCEVSDIAVFMFFPVSDNFFSLLLVFRVNITPLLCACHAYWQVVCGHGAGIVRKAHYTSNTTVKPPVLFSLTFNKTI